MCRATGWTGSAFDAQENPLPTIQGQRFHEVQSHITLTGHITDALLTIVATDGGFAHTARSNRRSKPVLIQTFSAQAMNGLSSTPTTCIRNSPLLGSRAS
ncbi:hypothetical protein [Marivita lacus]|uniref:hypothetical protein n=1 Tax=Marivita lacus TaxID=1323742 RepID=UPI00227AC970|nr:hypothetical protein [Marivita lacus]